MGQIKNIKLHIVTDIKTYHHLPDSSKTKIWVRKTRNQREERPSLMEMLPREPRSSSRSVHNATLLKLVASTKLVLTFMGSSVGRLDKLMGTPTLLPTSRKELPGVKIPCGPTWKTLPSTFQEPKWCSLESRRNLNGLTSSLTWWIQRNKNYDEFGEKCTI